MSQELIDHNSPHALNNLLEEMEKFDAEGSLTAYQPSFDKSIDTTKASNSQSDDNISQEDNLHDHEEKVFVPNSQSSEDEVNNSEEEEPEVFTPLTQVPKEQHINSEENVSASESEDQQIDDSSPKHNLSHSKEDDLERMKKLIAAIDQAEASQEEPNEVLLPEVETKEPEMDDPPPDTILADAPPLLTEAPTEVHITAHVNQSESQHVPKKPKRRSSPRKKRSSSSDEEPELSTQQKKISLNLQHLDNIIDKLLITQILHTNDDLVFMDEIGVVMRDTWIDCCLTNEKYPTLQSWCQSVAKAKGLSKRQIRSLKIMEEVYFQDKPLISYLEVEEDNIEASGKSKSISPKPQPTLKSNGGQEIPEERNNTLTDPIPVKCPSTNAKDTSEDHQLSDPSDLENKSQKSSQKQATPVARSLSPDSMPDLVSQSQFSDHTQRTSIRRSNEILQDVPSADKGIAKDQNHQPVVDEEIPLIKKSPRKLPFSSPLADEKVSPTKRKRSPSTSPRKRKSKANDANADQWIVRRRNITSEFDAVSDVSDSSKKKQVTISEMMKPKHSTSFICDLTEDDTDHTVTSTTDETTTEVSDNILMPPPPPRTFSFKRKNASPDTQENVTPSTSKPSKSPPEKKSTDKTSNNPIEQLKPLAETQFEDSQVTKKQKVDHVSSTYSPVILGSGLKSAMLEHIRLLTKKIGGDIVQEFSTKVTHVVVLADELQKTKRTIKYANGVLAGLWIVSYDWILESFSQGKWVNESTYEILGDSKGIGSPMKAREAIKAKGERLFEGCSFYFFGQFSSPSKEELTSLINSGKGKVLSRLPRPLLHTKDMLELEQEHTFILVNVTTSTPEELNEVFYQCGRIPIDFNWLLDCVSNYNLLDTIRYRVSLVTDATFETQNSLAY